MNKFAGIIFRDFLGTVSDVTIAILPLLSIFVVMQIFFLKLKAPEVKKILLGFVLTYIGLIFLIQGTHVAFIPVGERVGEIIGSSPHRWLVIPIGFAMGFVSAYAEPALRILSNQVDDVTAHSINKKTLILTISTGVALSITLSMIRLLLDVHALFFLIPGYALIFFLSRFVEPTFAAVAFDSGGVVIGPMCVSFILSFTLKVSDVLNGGDAMAGFGMIGMVAMSPIIAVMVLGCYYNFKHKRSRGG
ncbi:MAG: DUF1538 domain-containing protein [Oscillospiraceae bacterium]|jgi:hypothetical protein|nr:DUF1538 domain-containing protein [Oscillospiraceae bacterium]